MPKEHNTKEYRDAKRVTTFVSPKVKAAVLKEARKNKRSVSKEAGFALEERYLGGG